MFLFIKPKMFFKITLANLQNEESITFEGKTADNSHIVSPSPWPFFTSNSIFALVVSLTSYMHGYLYSLFFLFTSLFLVLLCMGLWWRDIIREGTFEGHHNAKVQLGLRLGMLLFIISEIMFFFAFFWAFYHSSISPAINIGACWPPKGIEVLYAFGVPFLNTVLLLSSGATVTWCHHSIVAGNLYESVFSLITTIFLAIIFTFCQYFEYINANFTIADSIYGSCFYMATGFHGFHVFVGTCFLFVCLLRLINHHFTKEHHYGFEAGAWYWHFVDVVWILLFGTVYWWGN